MGTVMDDKMFNLALQVSAMQERLDGSIATAKADRAEMKAEIQSVKEDVQEIKANTQSVLDQIRGASKFARATWVVGGVIVSSGIWLSGILHKFFPFLPR